MRLAIVAMTALLMLTGAADAQSPAKGMHADQFATEGDATAHCSGQTVVWMNTRWHVYHFAGTRDYGHTKHGAYMCQADADKAEGAARNEHPPAGH